MKPHTTKIKVTIRYILLPLWLLIFVIYLPIWYIQMSWYYFDFSDYRDGYLIALARITNFLKI